MKTGMHPETRRYLAAVDREAAALPAEERRDLVADLDEHIQVALAERPGSLAAILAELGDPEEIAATALRESRFADPRRQSRDLARLCISLWAMAAIVGDPSLLPGCGFLTAPATVVELAALVVLYRSPWWTTERKWIAFLLLVLPNVALNELAGIAGGGWPAGVAVLIVKLAVRGAVLTWLWRVRTAPVAVGLRQPTPRWLVNLRIGALVLAVLIVVGLAAGALWTYISLSGSLVTSKV